MPYYITPDSDLSRLAFLNNALEAGREDRAAGITYLSDDTLEVIESIVTRFKAAYDDARVRLSDRMGQVQRANDAMETLQTYMRDMWACVRRRANREELSPAYPRLYGLTGDGRPPTLTSRREWQEMAAVMIEADATAAAKGYRPVLEPSADELQTVLNAAVAAVKEIGTADRLYTRALKELDVLRPEVDAVCLAVISELRFGLHREDAPRQRHVMRTYGARFRYRPGETPDPEEPAEEAAAGDEAAAAVEIPAEAPAPVPAVTAEPAPTNGRL